MKLAFLEKSNRSVASAVVNGAMLLTLLGAVIFLVRETQGRLERIASIRDDLRARSNAAESFSALRAEYEEIKPYLPVIDALIPSENQLLNFPRDISTLARQEGMDATAIFRGGSQAPPGEPSGLRSAEITVTTVGDFTALLSFLRRLDTSTYSITLDSLDFIRQKENTFRAAMNGKIFSQ